MLSSRCLLQQHGYACNAWQSPMLCSRRIPNTMRVRRSPPNISTVAAWPQLWPQQAPTVVCTAVEPQRAQALPNSFRVQRITGDGSCMFRALVQGEHHAKHGTMLAADKEQDSAMQLRKDVVAELRKRREEIEPFLPGIADDFDDYLRKMSQPGVWGGEPELVMASHVMQRPIHVYQPQFGRPPQHIVIYGEDMTATPVHVLWSGAHYDLLLPQIASKL